MAAWKISGLFFFYMKHSVKPGSISSFVKIVNFVGRAGSEYGLPMAVIKIKSPGN